MTLTHQHIARTRETLAFLEGVHRNLRWSAKERDALATVSALVDRTAETLAAHMPAEPEDAP